MVLNAGRGVGAACLVALREAKLPDDLPRLVLRDILAGPLGEHLSDRSSARSVFGGVARLPQPRPVLLS